MTRKVARIPGPWGRGWAAKVVTFAAAGLLLGGCPPPPYDASLLRQAAGIAEKEQRWDEVRPLIQAHLLKYPEDPVGHFYLGLSFLHRKDAQLTLAEGELLTAQALLERNDEIPEGSVDKAPEVFKGEVFQKTALVYMRAYYESFRFNVPPEAQRDLLKKAIAQTELGLQANPTSIHLKDYQDALKGLLEGLPERTPDIMTQSAEKGSAI
jgi:hypothetical protein